MLQPPAKVLPCPKAKPGAAPKAHAPNKACMVGNGETGYTTEKCRWAMHAAAARQASTLVTRAKLISWQPCGQTHGGEGMLNRGTSPTTGGRGKVCSRSTPRRVCAWPGAARRAPAMQKQKRGWSKAGGAGQRQRWEGGDMALHNRVHLGQKSTWWWLISRQGNRRVGERAERPSVYWREGLPKQWGSLSSRVPHISVGSPSQPAPKAMNNETAGTRGQPQRATLVQRGQSHAHLGMGFGGPGCCRRCLETGPMLPLYGATSKPTTNSLL